MQSLCRLDRLSIRFASLFFFSNFTRAKENIYCFWLNCSSLAYRWRCTDGAVCIHILPEVNLARQKRPNAARLSFVCHYLLLLSITEYSANVNHCSFEVYLRNKRLHRNKRNHTQINEQHFKLFENESKQNC